MGNEQQLAITFLGPANLENEIITNNIMAGEYYSIVLNASGIAKKSLDVLLSRLENLKINIENNNISGIDKDDFIGDIFHSVMSTYFYELDAIDKVIAKTMNATHMRLPSMGTFSVDLEATYLFGVPKSVEAVGMLMDVDRISYNIAERSGDSTTVLKFGLASGPISSFLEHSVPERLLTTATESYVEGISAVKAISIANSQGIPIYTITPSNASTVIPNLALDSTYIADISNAMNAGMVVTVPRTAVDFNGKPVVGYIILDPVTGAGAYMVGVSNGAAIEVLLTGLLKSLVWGAFSFITIALALLGAPYLALLSVIIGTIAITATSWALSGGDPYAVNPAAILIGLFAGWTVSSFINITIAAFGLSLLAPISTILLPALMIISLMVMVAVIIDYMFAFAFLFRRYRREFYA